MRPKDVLQALLGKRRWSIIEYHEEIENPNFGATGVLMNDYTGQQFRFSFYNRGEANVLEWIDRTRYIVVGGGKKAPYDATDRGESSVVPIPDKEGDRASSEATWPGEEV
jgi:hypothetical protein